MQLNEVRAVVTGGVSGLGFAVAQHLVRNGGKVALFDVNDDKGAAAVAELGDGKAEAGDAAGDQGADFVELHWEGPGTGKSAILAVAGKGRSYSSSR